MKPDPTPYAALESAAAPTLSLDGQCMFYLRGGGLQQLWCYDVRAGATGQLTEHDEKVALLRRAPGDNRLIYGTDAGGDERQQLWLHDGEDR
ncbi:MAG TPA: hypothetical protein VE650_09655, partial [Acetobacteraceae bacterium]|nr:hypothetical protein [Acetobacteraceae bacterium]